MTPDPTLTDEELAEMGTKARRENHADGNDPECPWCAIAHPSARRLIAALRASREEVGRLRATLDFYADPANWQATCIAAAGPDGPNPGASEWESGPAIDGGYRARVALNVPVHP